MSLAKTIIHGSTTDVAASLRAVERIDEIDEYGYTPLVQCAIVNEPEKAKLLLEAGADANFTDLTGRTPLHWAAENNSLDLVKLLLAHKADPNAYTFAGQSTLVMPLLHRFDAVKKALYKKSADLNFAQDFINAKLLGHRFSLEGRTDIVDHTGKFIETEFEGFYLEFSMALILEALQDFLNNFGGKHLRPYFPYVEKIIQSLQQGRALLSYQHYLLDKARYLDEIHGILAHDPLVLPLSYSGHGIALIRIGDVLIRCDRGEFGREHGTVIVYDIGRPDKLTRSFMVNLLYRRQERSYVDETLANILELWPKDYLPLPPQLSGNCSWANIEAVIPAMLYLLLSQDAASASHQERQRQALYFYQEWLNWDKSRALHFCIESFKEANAARKASKAAIMAAILFQRCDFESEQDLAFAEKVLPILTDKTYRYILRSYIQVFQNKKQPRLLQNLEAFLDYTGIDIHKF